MAPRRVGVIFGGRSGEHEVSLASAASVIAALEQNGHTVVPIGIARDGRWVVGGDPLRALADEARLALPSGDGTGSVKKALADRAEARSRVTDTALARNEPAGSVPSELRQGLDVVVIMLHGPYGEDGTIQGLLEVADLPYVGAGVAASAVSMDKAMMKALFRAAGLPIVDYTVVLRPEWRAQRQAVARRIAETVGFPCFVKPCNLGSSVGISKVANAAALPAAIDEAARHDRKIIVERAVRERREIEVSVLGNDEPIASVPGEIRYEGEWYDYATKYTEGQAQVVIPAPVSPAITTRVRELAVEAFRAVDAAGMARVDFFLEGDRPLVNEINTIPGFTATSAYARLWEASGLEYGALVERLIELGLERHREKGGP
ncbi:MAG TPA: D-alanine--D-alanine ligase family protein [Methylomirabilota bacterium]|jgi:D-alanine-D-alanine ligase